MIAFLVQAENAGRSKVVRGVDVVEAKALVPSERVQKHQLEY